MTTFAYPFGYASATTRALVRAAGVVAACRVELLTFLHEQAVSITAHRYGTPNHLSDALI